MTEKAEFTKNYSRTGTDRRLGSDRRKLINCIPIDGIIDNRSGSERRRIIERRDGWVKVSRWSSAYLGIPVFELT